MRRWASPGWALIDQGTHLQIIPMNDVVAHDDNEDCACLPAVEETDHHLWMITHNAWDGRE